MFDVYEYFSTTFYRDFFFHHCTDIDIISNFTKQDSEIFKFKNYIIDYRKKVIIQIMTDVLI